MLTQTEIHENPLQLPVDCQNRTANLVVPVDVVVVVDFPCSYSACRAERGTFDGSVVGAECVDG